MDLEVTKQFEMRQMIERNCEEVKQKLKELQNWQEDIKRAEKEKKENTIDENNLPPIRSRSNLNQINDNENKEIDDNLEREEAELVQNENILQNSPHTIANIDKENGNNCVKRQEYKQAVDYYSKAIDTYCLDPIYYTNRALCFLKLERLQECIQDCTKAIGLDTRYTKAYYRRMQAEEMLANNESALKDCLEIVKLEPNNKQFRRDYERIKNKVSNSAKIKKSNEEINNNKVTKFIETPKPRKLWSKFNYDAKEIDFVNKSPHLRSKKTLKRIQITETYTKPEPLEKIPDHIVDKLFNNFTGECTSNTSSSSNAIPMPSTSKYCPEYNFSPKITSYQTFNNLSINDRSLDEIFENLNKNLINTKNTEENGNKISQNEASPFNARSKDALELRHETQPNLNQTLKENQNYELDIFNSNNSKIENCQDANGLSKMERPLQLIGKKLQIPSTGVQFCNMWQGLSTEERCNYLKLIILEAKMDLGKLLGPSLDNSILTEILEIMATDFVKDNLDVIKVLKDLSANPEMDILSLFLEKKDKIALENLVEYMKSNNVDENVVSFIKDGFNLKE